MESSDEGEKDGEAERQDMSVGEVPCLIYVLLYVWYPFPRYSCQTVHFGTAVIE